MISMPPSVARLIMFNHQHPVSAWRAYYGLSLEKLAEYLEMQPNELAAIESSNQHLRPDNLDRLSQIFGVYPEALNIRHNNYCE